MQAETIAAWQQYERQVDDRYGRPAAAGAFFVHDAFKLASGLAGASHGRAGVDGPRAVVRARRARNPRFPMVRIHHWAGAIFIPGVTLDHVLRYLNDRAGRESEAFDDV